MTNDEPIPRDWGFGIRHSFVIRASSFVLVFRGHGNVARPPDPADRRRRRAARRGRQRGDGAPDLEGGRPDRPLPKGGFVHVRLVPIRPAPGAWLVSGTMRIYPKSHAAQVAQVEQGRRRNGEVKRYVIAELDKLGLAHIPSAANFMMIDMRRDVRPLVEAMRKRGVEVGRFFPALPNHMRVTVGTRDEMDAFLGALRQAV